MADLKFLSQIRETEQQAADLLSQAAESSRLMLENTRHQSGEIIRVAREEALLWQHQQIEHAEAEAMQIITLARSLAEETAARESAVSANRLEEAARLVAERIVYENAHR
jgi:vacuolar-type H+-ATPase subunit H